MFAKDKGKLLDHLDESSGHDINPAIFSYLLDQRVNYSLVPHALGGEGFGYLEEFKLIKSGAEVEPRFGWLVFQMAGNVSRILSIVGMKKGQSLIESYGKNLVVAYDTNPNLCVFELQRNSEYTITGQMNFGTLSTEASHFGFSSYVDGLKKFCLTKRENVDIIKREDDIAMGGTGTCKYEVKPDKTIPATDIYDMPSIVEGAFKPFYSFPRSPVKHLAWSAGCLRYLSQYDHKNQSQDTFDAAFALEEKLYQHFEKLEDHARAGTDGVSELFPVLPDMQAVVLKTAMKIHLDNPACYFGDMRFRRALGDILCASLHTTMRVPYRLMEGKTASAILNDIRHHI